MQALTKKPHTKSENIELRFLGPKGKHEDAVEALRSLGFVDVSDSVSWRDSFSYTDDQLPGVTLAGARSKESLTQRALSELTKIPQRHISEMENGKRPIGKQTAKKFGKALHINYKVFL